MTVLRLAEMTSTWSKPWTAQRLPNYRMLLTHTPMEAPCIPTNWHSPSLYTTSFCLQVIRNQNTHRPLSHGGESAVITSTSSARTCTALVLCAAFLCVWCPGEAWGCNSELYFTTKDMQQLWASSCHSRPEFLPLNFPAFSELKRKLFLKYSKQLPRQRGKGNMKNFPLQWLLRTDHHYHYLPSFHTYSIKAQN